VTIGADAHKPEDVYSNTDECMEYIRDVGFELCNRAVVEKILQKKK
jgi:histidinol phosphatase-like PHP family hydrolase